MSFPPTSPVTAVNSSQSEIFSPDNLEAYAPPFPRQVPIPPLLPKFQVRHYLIL
ncbi:MAG: hypothetical protein ACI8RA_001310 [Chlamydiales bacterium]|jgi:hypothetical protein